MVLVTVDGGREGMLLLSAVARIIDLKLALGGNSSSLSSLYITLREGKWGLLLSMNNSKPLYNITYILYRYMTGQQQIKKQHA